MQYLLDSLVHCVETRNRSVVSCTLHFSGYPFGDELSPTPCKPVRSVLITLRSTSAKADCAEGSAFHQKVWMPSGPGADQLFAFFKAFFSLVSSRLLGPSEEVLPTLFFVSFSKRFR